MLRALFLLSFLSLLSACSIYKSAVRKDFESESPNHVKKASFLGVCEKRGPIPAWIEREFPALPTEILVTEADLEIRQLASPDGRLILRSDRLLDDGSFESCKREFANEEQWLETRASYFEAHGLPILD